MRSHRKKHTFPSPPTTTLRSLSITPTTPHSPTAPHSPHSPISQKLCSPHPYAKPLLLPLEQQKYQNYKRKVKLTFGKERMDSIQRALDIGKKTKKSTAERLSAKQLYLGYGKNPFLVGQRGMRGQAREAGSGTHSQQKKTLLDALNMLRDTDHLDSIKRRVDQIQAKTIHLQNAAQHIKQTTVHRKSTTTHRKQTTSHSRRQHSHTHQAALHTHQAALDNPETIQASSDSGWVELQGIVSIQEQNFFQEKRDRQPFDLFKILCEPNHAMFLCGRQQLQQYNFSLDSMHNPRNKAFNQAIFKDLCAYSRMAAIKNNSKSVPLSYRTPVLDFEQTLERISFWEMIMAAKGQLIPQMLYFQGLAQGEDTQSEPNSLSPELTEIPYPDNVQHKQVLESTEQIGRVEIEYYGKQKISDKQQNYLRTADRYKAAAKAVSKLESQAISNQIRHAALVERLMKQKERIMCKQLEEVDVEPGRKGLDEKIKKSKRAKDKGQLIAINTMIEVVRQSKRFSKLHLNPNNPHKTPTAHLTQRTTGQAQRTAQKTQRPVGQVGQAPRTAGQALGSAESGRAGKSKSKTKRVL